MITVRTLQRRDKMHERRAAIWVCAVTLMAVSVPATAAQSAPAQNYYARWSGATSVMKEELIANAISGIRTGWEMGSAQAQADIAGSLVDEYKRGGVSIRIPAKAGTMKVTDPPGYSHSLRYYTRAVDRAYRRFPQYRTWDVPNLMLCFADRPKTTCPRPIVGERAP
jgi:hypothetical protein